MLPTLDACAYGSDWRGDGVDAWEGDECGGGDGDEISSQAAWDSRVTGLADEVIESDE